MDTATRHSTAAEAAAALSGDASMADRVRAHTQACAVVSSLINLRVARGLTQTQIAHRMGVSPSTVSKIEASADQWLRIGDVVGYARALGVQARLAFDDPSLPAAESIKSCVLEIHERLNHLAELAQGVGDDRVIVDKIHQFYGEVLFNFLVRFGDSYSRMPGTMKLGNLEHPSTPPPSSQVQIDEPATVLDAGLQRGQEAEVTALV
jgi:transcriptional regulator with XRE-family HTH domain